MKEPARGRSDASTGQTPERYRKRILLVEDNEADRDVYGGLLWYNGYEVLHVPDGESALAEFRESAPDLVLLDILLPGISGIEVARRLRAEGFAKPIILLSAVARDQLGEDITALGAAAYLEKPIDPFSVVREVMRLVGPSQGSDR